MGGWAAAVAHHAYAIAAAAVEQGSRVWGGSQRGEKEKKEKERKLKKKEKIRKKKEN